MPTKLPWDPKFSFRSGTAFASSQVYTTSALSLKEPLVSKNEFSGRDSLLSEPISTNSSGKGVSLQHGCDGGDNHFQLRDYASGRWYLETVSNGASEQQ